MSDQTVLILLIALTSLVVLVALAVEEPEATPTTEEVDPERIGSDDEAGEPGLRIDSEREDHLDARRPADVPEAARR